MGFLSGRVVKKPAVNAGHIRYAGLIPGLGRSPGVESENQEVIPVFLPGKFHGQKRLSG